MPRKTKPPALHPKLVPYAADPPCALIREQTRLSEIEAYLGKTKARWIWDGRQAIDDETANVLACLTPIKYKEWIRRQRKWELFGLLDTAVTQISMFHGESSVRMFFYWFQMFRGRMGVEHAVERARQLAEAAYANETSYQTLVARYGREAVAR